MKKQILLALLIIIIVTGALFGYFFYKSQPISENTVCVERINREWKTQISEEVKNRCEKAGGELRNELTALGLTSSYTFGCYPKEKASDAGEKCTYNFTCEGDCLWLAGDIISNSSSKTCSSYKKPYFIYKGSLKNCNIESNE
jgi:hypothetical protein